MSMGKYIRKHNALGLTAQMQNIGNKSVKLCQLCLMKAASFSVV